MLPNYAGSKIGSRRLLGLPGCTCVQEFQEFKHAIQLINQATRARQTHVELYSSTTTGAFVHCLYNADFIFNYKLLRLPGAKGDKFNGIDVCFHDNVAKQSFSAINLLPTFNLLEECYGKGFAKKQALYCGIDFIY